ncbi:MAG: stealth conserved region 3 domain-containing protein, partial [Candidatus Limnocylindrales bacterium]
DVLIWNDVFPGTFFTPDGKTVAHLAPHGAVIMWCQAVDAGTATDWQAARVNGARLLLERYGVLPTRQHQHVPHALRRSVIETLEGEFPDAFESARRSRFREPSDVLLIGLVYHNWAVLQGLATVRAARQLTIGGDSADVVDPARLASIDFLCVNDVRGSALDERSRRAKQLLFESRLPIRGSAERVVRDSPEATAD